MEFFIDRLNRKFLFEFLDTLSQLRIAHIVDGDVDVSDNLSLFAKAPSSSESRYKDAPPIWVFLREAL